METFNWTNFIFNILSSSMVTIFLISVTPVLKKAISRYIDNKFEEKIVKYQHDLNLVTENAKLDIQRKIYDFNLYSSKKHEIYAELYKKVLIAHGQITGLMGFRKSINLNFLDKSYIIEFLKNNNFNENDITELSHDWDLNRKTQVDKITKYLRNKEINEADSKLVEANNYYLESKLYMSNKIDNISNELIDEIRKLFIIYEMANDYNYYPEDNVDKELGLKKSLEEKRILFCDSLKNELSKGDYAT
jgi:hypothetical protein